MFMKLYTQEEIDRHFDGLGGDVAHRAAIFEQWKIEWSTRTIHINNNLEDFRTFLKQNNIPRVDYTLTWTSPRSCVYYFRNEEDYLAAVLKFA